MPVTSHAPATYADLEALPPNMVGELIDGALIAMPRPAPRHATASFNLGDELGGPFRRGRGGPGGWVFMTEPELHFGTQVLVPDLAGWRRERMPTMPETAFIEVAPDWVCEVVSPSTEQYDRGAKRRIYGQVGVGHMWLLNPISRHLEVWVNRDDDLVFQELIEDGEDVSADPFSAISFPIKGLWGFEDGDAS